MPRKVLNILFLCFFVAMPLYLHCAPPSEAMIATMSNMAAPSKIPIDPKKVKEIEAFLKEYDSADINATPLDELKAALSELADAYTTIMPSADDNTASPGKEQLFKIFNNSTSSMMRFNAYQTLLSFAAGGCCGRPKAEINPEERLNILTLGIKDPDYKIRIMAGTMLESMRQSRVVVCPVAAPVDQPKPFDENVERLYNENIKDNAFFKQTFEYMQIMLGVGYDKDSLLKFAKDFRQLNPGIKFYVLTVLSKYELFFAANEKTSAEYYSIFLSGLKDENVWVRFICFTTLMNAQKYVKQISRLSSTQLEDFFKTMTAADLYYMFYTGNVKIPVNVLPDKQVLARILKNNPNSTVKQAIFIKLLRNSIVLN